MNREIKYAFFPYNLKLGKSIERIAINKQKKESMISALKKTYKEVILRESLPSNADYILFDVPTNESPCTIERMIKGWAGNEGCKVCYEEEFIYQVKELNNKIIEIQNKERLFTD